MQEVFAYQRNYKEGQRRKLDANSTPHGSSGSWAGQSAGLAWITHKRLCGRVTVIVSAEMTIAEVNAAA